MWDQAWTVLGTPLTKHWEMAWFFIHKSRFAHSLDSFCMYVVFEVCMSFSIEKLWKELIFKNRGKFSEIREQSLLFYTLLFWLHSSKLLSGINNFVLLGLFYFWSVLAAFLLTFNFGKFANFPILHFIWQSTFNIKVFLDNCLIRSS